MNFQQLEYICKLDTHRHFTKAAGKSFVKQSTLSMMVRRLEEELGVKIFDRSKQPIIPTKEGEEIILRARQILSDVLRLREYASELNGEVTGEVHLGIIPTLAPYLIPMFLQSFTEKFPQLKIYIKEMITDEIIAHLKTGDLNVGILATPLHNQHIAEHPLFFEEFYVYASQDEKLPQKKYVLPENINLNHLWLLEEGHCFRNQVFNFCKLKKLDKETLHYEAGSIETLINLVDHSEGITIIPQLALLNLKADQKSKVRKFVAPQPGRQISLVVGKNFSRHQLLKELQKEIISKIPFELKSKDRAVVKLN